MCASREEAEWLCLTLARHVYPQDYEPAASDQRTVKLARARAPDVRPTIFPMFRANDEARRAVAAFLANQVGDRLPIVITLRQSEFVPSRNSRTQEWVAFADELDDKYAAVFVPDTAQSPGRLDRGLERHIISGVASWSIPFRMALYEAAFFNMAHMGGPLELALYNDKCRYAIFLPLNKPLAQRRSF